ncbi:GFA family protein [Pseudomonas sp. SK3(2021)]|uniref:GFA family protein n=1 Tax=Pseudomonas sp. SK3(2021) TaxID=2841064 RepID=UPI00192BD9AC|nr:GFA family protein [Pseudomonas sp. SK3(2021)]QQZ40054.1 GFA family protein [Pseudomonas sp. SK3(2021)]
MTHQGSCLCGGIRYEINGELTDVLNCHCSMCRKLHAAAFRTRAKVRSQDWKTLCGEQLLSFYQSSPGEWKSFCSVCGSSLFTRFDADPHVLGFPLGTLDSDPQVSASRHVFVGSKAPWFTITDDLAQHDTY